MEKTQAAINVLLSNCFCVPYLPVKGMEANLIGEECKKISELDAGKDRIHFILDKYIYNNVENANLIFLQYVIQNIDLEIESKKKTCCIFPEIS